MGDPRILATYLRRLNLDLISYVPSPYNLLVRRSVIGFASELDKGLRRSLEHES